MGPKLKLVNNFAKFKLTKISRTKFLLAKFSQQNFF